MPSTTTSLECNGQTHVLTWNDRYYEEKPDVVAVFDVDIEKGKRQLARRRVLRILTSVLPFCLFLAWTAVDFGGALFWFHAANMFFIGLLKCCDAVKQTMTGKSGLAEHMAHMEIGIRCDDVNGSYTVLHWEKLQCRLQVYRPTWWNLPCRVLFTQAFPGIEEEYVSWPWAVDNARQYTEVVNAMKNRAPGMEKAGGMRLSSIV